MHACLVADGNGMHQSNAKHALKILLLLMAEIVNSIAASIVIIFSLSINMAELLLRRACSNGWPTTLVL